MDWQVSGGDRVFRPGMSVVFQYTLYDRDNWATGSLGTTGSSEMLFIYSSCIPKDKVPL